MKEEASGGDRNGTPNIRSLIQDLEDIKDKIVLLLGEQKLDDSSRSMWISDVKEAYYGIVSAYKLLDREHEDSSRASLANAKSRMLQSASELKALGDGDDDKQAQQLESQLREAFQRCWTAISAKLDSISPRKEEGSVAPTKRVIKISGEEYDLPCSVCSETAVIFKIGVPKFLYTDERRLIYQGITKSTSFELSIAKPVFEKLEADRISELHSYLLSDEEMEGGLDAYCPECDRVYCREHYDIEEEWDAGFYDCSYGTCPQGHRRMVDD